MSTLIEKADAVRLITSGRWKGCSVIGAGDKQIAEYQKALCFLDEKHRRLSAPRNMALAMKAIDEATPNLFLAAGPTGPSIRVTKDQMLDAIAELGGSKKQ